MSTPLWMAGALGFALEALRDLLGELRARGGAVALDEAARRIAQAVRRMPLDRLPPAQHAAAHTAMATAIINGVASVAGLSEATRKKLTDKVGRKLLRAAAKKLDKAADELLAKTDKWERLLK